MRTLTGITPSGTLHIGNYFGAMRPAIDAQVRGDCFYFIADYHSMTTVTDAAERRKIIDDRIAEVQRTMLPQLLRLGIVAPG